jgi:hypothetical protein
LIPLRGDGCGNYDCLVSGLGIGTGSVVFWDHEVYECPSHLLGSSLITYLEMWFDYVVSTYLPTGSMDPRFDPPELDGPPWIGEAELHHPWPTDEAWMVEHDPALGVLLDDPAMRKWLADQGD